jgi:hypothetical protein
MVSVRARESHEEVGYIDYHYKELYTKREKSGQDSFKTKLPMVSKLEMPERSSFRADQRSVDRFGKVFTATSSALFIDANNRCHMRRFRILWNTVFLTQSLL